MYTCNHLWKLYNEDLGMKEFMSYTEFQCEYNIYINKEVMLSKVKNEATGKELEKRIVNDINNRHGCFYHSIIKQFKEKYNKDIKAARHVGEKSHHDLVFTLTDGTEMKGEVKSSLKLDVDKWDTPWQGAVQFLNGTGGKWRIRRFYAEEWYKVMPSLKNRFNLQSDLPEFDEWFKTDANMCKPKTPFGVELKSMSKENKKEIRDIKTKFVEGLIVPEKEVRELIEDYNRECKEVLDDKDFWLCVCGDDIRLFGKVNSEVIKTITRDTTSKDLYYKVDSKTFNGIRIRWQNGSGIANISVQCT